MKFETHARAINYTSLLLRRLSIVAKYTELLFIVLQCKGSIFKILKGIQSKTKPSQMYYTN